MREFTSGRRRDREDRLATEEPLEIRLGWPGVAAHRVAVTMRTPGHDFELAAGFLRSEGVVGSTDDVHTIAYCTDDTLTPEEEFNVVTVSLTGAPARAPASRYAGPAGSVSACGVCGKQSIDDVLGACETHGSARWNGFAVSREVLGGLPELLRQEQRVFDSTGGLHAAGLFEVDGRPVVVREDVGRHNAVDKVVGARMLEAAATALPLLCVSGRIGFEIVQKATVAGVAVLAAVGAPSSLAVSLAKETGLCTVGFLGRERFVVYSVPERIGV